MASPLTGVDGVQRHAAGVQRRPARFVGPQRVLDVDGLSVHLHVEEVLVLRGVALHCSVFASVVVVLLLHVAQEEELREGTEDLQRRR